MEGFLKGDADDDADDDGDEVDDDNDRDDAYEMIIRLCYELLDLLHESPVFASFH